MINHRAHCKKQKQRKNDWDTVKPLGNYFGDDANVTLIDDSRGKVMSHERRKLLWVPAWDGSKDDQVLLRLLWMLVTVRSMKLRNLNYMTEYISRTLFRTSNLVLEPESVSEDGSAQWNARNIMIKMGFSGRFFASNRVPSEYDLVTDEDTGEVIIVHSCKNISHDSRKEIIDKLLLLRR